MSTTTGSNAGVRASLHPDLRNDTTTNGNAVDVTGFEEALILLNLGDMAAGATLDVKVQESADGSTGWTDIAGAAFAQFGDTDDNSVHMGRVRTSVGKEQFLRIVSTAAGAANIDCGAQIVVLGTQYADTDADTFDFDV